MSIDISTVCKEISVAVWRLRFVLTLTTNEAEVSPQSEANHSEDTQRRQVRQNSDGSNVMTLCQVKTDAHIADKDTAWDDNQAELFSCTSHILSVTLAGVLDRDGKVVS